MINSCKFIAAAVMAVVLAGCISDSWVSSKLLVYHIDMNSQQMNRAAIERHLAHVALQGYNAFQQALLDEYLVIFGPRLKRFH